jgi:parallel beta-helix repeat protein
MTQQRGWIAGVAIGVIVTGVMWVGAGELTPPPGAITSTMKDLDTVEARTPIADAGGATIAITDPGSYYFVENISGSGIEISASNVTIDLNGFSLSNAPAPFAIRQLSGMSVTIKSGYITDSADTSIELSGGTNHLVERVTVVGAGNSGIVVGSDSIVRHCAVLNSATTGIQGIGAGRVIVSNCVASGNGTATPGSGITVPADSIVVDCISRNNSGYGIATASVSTIRGCTVSGNGLFGINAVGSCMVTECLASSNSDAGISAGAGSTVTNCTATLNGGTPGALNSDGINVGPNSSVIDCSADQNWSDGIQGSGNCRIVGNNCIANGNGGDGAGIHTSGTRNLIDGNHTIGNDRGIDVDGEDNVIMRNTASNTINYEIVANNRVGAIVSAPNSGPIDGSTGGAGVGTTDPWANFSF